MFFQHRKPFLNSLFLLLLLSTCFATLAQQAGFIPDTISTKNPWTVRDMNDSTGNFTFAIVGDRTGGMIPGVFSEAVDKLNLLQPDFVMSVGDLIDGYTTNEGLINKEYSEFEQIISRLTVPFFRLPGNHDISNASLEAVWEKRFGRTYYHFLYKNVLFICLNTQDPPPQNISDQQVAYFETVLARYPDVRWTFVFMHVPLWQYEKKDGFEKIEALLNARRYTVFSGHHHNYLKAVKHGMKYFTLATTGGGSELRGAQFGEFEHIMWVTVKPDTPTFANLDLEGIRDENVVTGKDYPMVQALRTGSWFNIKPVVSPTAEFSEIHTNIILNNPASEPLQVRGLLPETTGLSFSPMKVDTLVPGASEMTIPLSIHSSKPRLLSELTPVSLTLGAAYAAPRQEILKLDCSREVVIDWIHTAPKIKTPLQIDGDLTEWRVVPMEMVKRPGFIKESWAWRGESDGYFTFGVCHDETHLYIGIRAIDDNLLHNKKSAEALQDKFYVVLNTVPGRKNLSSGERDSSAKYMKIIVAQSDLTRKPLSDVRGLNPEDLQMGCTSNSHSMTAELVIPLNAMGIINTEGKTWVRINIGYMDQDKSTNLKPSVLWWRPLWGEAGDYPESGMFVLQ